MSDTASQASETGGTSRMLRAAAQQLLRAGVIYAHERPEDYKTLRGRTAQVSGILEPLDLQMQVDELRGLVFLQIADGSRDSEDQWTHPLVRRERLTLEQSLLVAILRRHYIAHENESGIGAPSAQVDLHELAAEFVQFTGSSGSETQDTQRIRTLLDQLRRHAIVGDISEHETVRVYPLIAHLANPESLDALLGALRERQSDSMGNGDG